jgi:hypothetical protein
MESGRWQVPVEHRSIIGDLFLQAVGDALGQSVGIGFGLRHQWRHRTDKDSLGNPLFAVPGQVVLGAVIASVIRGSLQ